MILANESLAQGELSVLVFDQPGFVSVPRMKDDVYVGNPVIANPRLFAVFSRYTGEPRTMGEWSPNYYLNKKTIGALRSWRNEYDQPYSAAAHNPYMTLKSVHYHSVRVNLGYMLATFWVIDQFENYFLEEFNVDWDPDPDPDNRVSWGGWRRGPMKGYLEEWYRRHVSEFAAETRFLGGRIAECFAWYTAPYYVKGSLPEKLERVLEVMARGQQPDMGRYIAEDTDADGDFAERFPEMLKSLAKVRQRPMPGTLKEPLPVGADIRHFLFTLERQALGEKWRRHPLRALPGDERSESYLNIPE